MAPACMSCVNAGMDLDAQRSLRESVAAGGTAVFCGQKDRKMALTKCNFSQNVEVGKAKVWTSNSVGLRNTCHLRVATHATITYSCPPEHLFSVFNVSQGLIEVCVLRPRSSMCVEALVAVCVVIVVLLPSCVSSGKLLFICIQACYLRQISAG